MSTWRLSMQDKANGISVKAWHSVTEGADIIPFEYSLGLFFGSYEARCLTSSQLLKKQACRDSLVILFKEKDNRGLRNRYDKKLLAQVKKCTRNNVTVIDNVSVRDIELLLSGILSNVTNTVLSNDDVWFFDISGAPKPHFLSLIGYLRGQVQTPKLHVFHPSGHYEKKEKPNDAFTFTKGPDEYIWVPWMWGQPTPSQPWTYIFLLGFEGSRSHDAFTRFEPTKTIAFVANPGYRENYVERALEANKAFLREAEPQLLYAHASDIVSAWGEMRRALDRVGQEANLCIVPLGPKPHALAGGLAALCTGVPSVLYLLPRSYNVHDVQAGEEIWLYEVEL